jgi:hypothetical protein
MNVLTLTWHGGENNPFEFFNKKLRESLSTFGAQCFDLRIDENFTKSFLSIEKRIDIVITWQGLLTNMQSANSNNVWEEIKTPIVSIHGDHPCLMPINHAADSAYIKHFYAFSNHAEYSEKYFPRKNPVYYSLFGNFFNQDKNKNLEKNGSYFVFPKNLDDSYLMQDLWRKNFPKIYSDFLIMVASEIRNNYEAGTCRDHHALIDELLTQEKFNYFVDVLKVRDNIAFFHSTHALLEKVYRNIASEAVIEELKDVPLLISGRGWDRFKSSPYLHHVFKDFDQVSSGEAQFNSEFGIIDVNPTVDGLHDRSMRAMAYNSGFLSNSMMNFNRLIGAPGCDLFFNGKKHSLREKAEIAMLDPLAHQNKVRDFSNAYNNKFSEFDFYEKLNYIQMSCN